MSDGAGRVGTGGGAADQLTRPRRGGAAWSRKADHALRVDACGPAGYRSVDRGPGGDREPVCRGGYGLVSVNFSVAVPSTSTVEIALVRTW
jgi:hypothetical protein